VLAVLAAFLFAAARSDVLARRIPNRLVLAGLAVGLALNAVLPEGTGFAGGLPGGIGLLKALYGAGLGLALLLPFYALRALGAGDVKLMAMVGAFLGPNGVIGAIIVTFICAGLLTVVHLLRMRALGRLLLGFGQAVLSLAARAGARGMPVPRQPYQSAGRLPFAVGIALGTVTYFLLALDGGLLFLSVF
jgi:prepilin peptidase CpaA